MELHLSLTEDRHLIKQIYQQLRAAILEGRLRSGDRLPPSRELARQLEVSRNTIVQAYDLLMSEGLVSGTIGAGTFVRDNLLGDRQNPETQTASTSVAIKPFWQQLELLEPAVARTDVAYDFGVGLPDKSRFPFSEWRRISAICSRQLAREPVRYDSPQGRLELRQAIAKYVSFSRAVRCHHDNLVVTNGAQQAFDLLAKVIIEPGMVVAFEEPGYSPARQVFEAYGAKVVGVPVDGEGIKVDCLPDLAKLIYTTPSHQFPLGMPMSLVRRLALLQWATQKGAIIIEDDYDSEFRFEGRPLESLQNLDRTGIVVYVGTFSKVMFPEIRLGFMVAPIEVKQAVVNAKRLSAKHSSSFAQARLAKFIQDGYLAKHIRKMHKVYALRRQILLRGLQAHLSEWLEPIPSVAGLHLTAHSTPELSLQDLLRQATQIGLIISSLAPFYASSTAAKPGLIFAYGAIEANHISAGLLQLRELAIANTN